MLTEVRELVRLEAERDEEQRPLQPKRDEEGDREVVVIQHVDNHRGRRACGGRKSLTWLDDAISMGWLDRRVRSQCPRPSWTSIISRDEFVRPYAALTLPN